MPTILDFIRYLYTDEYRVRYRLDRLRGESRLRAAWNALRYVFR